MRKQTPVVAAAVALLGSALTVLAVPATAGEEWWPVAPFYYFCRSDAPIGSTFYFTKTVRSDASVGRVELQNAFMDFMRVKYKYPHDNAVSCAAAAAGEMQANTESSRLQTIDNLHAANYEVVVTDWKYAH